MRARRKIRWKIGGKGDTKEWNGEKRKEKEERSMKKMIF